MSKTPQTLNNRALNRALLARQMLLTRVNLPVLDVIEHLVGMQAQDPQSPYFGLWTRIEGFLPEDLSHLILEKQAVRLALMRSTIHLASSRDSMGLRPLVQTVQESVLKHSFGKYLAGVDTQAVAEAGRELVESKPLTFSELGERLNKQWPNVESSALAAAVRTLVPLVQVPPRGVWGKSGQAVHTTMEAWIDTLSFSQWTIEDMILRYLAAFGPATIQDIQVWSGLTRLNEVIEQLRPQLIFFRDERGNELLDLPHAPRPDQTVPCPPKFLGGFDNILLSYADRGRIMDEAYRNVVITKNGIVKPTLLIDGMVSGVWSIKKEKGMVRLVIELFNKLPIEEHNELMEEGSRLLDFAANGETTREILFV